MTTDTVTREQLVERYIALDALETFMTRLMHPEPGALCLTGVLPHATYAKLLDEFEGPAEVVEEASRIFSVLWPGDDNLADSEYSDAVRRSDLLAARLFVLAAGRADAFAAEAAALIRQAEQPRAMQDDR